LYKIIIFIKNISEMQKLITLSILAVIISAAQAQKNDNLIRTIEGKVINEITNEAVSYTNISIEDTFFGTASDEDGYFELKIPEEMMTKQINFSAVGFERKSFSVTSLINRNYTIIKLKPQSYTIKDIDIAARSKVIIRILRMASENIPYNFIGGPLNLIANYENEKIIDDTVSTYQNAEVIIYDRIGYRQPSKLNAFRMRKYKINKSESDYRFSTGILNFDELLAMDWVRSASSILNPSLIKSFKLSMEERNLPGDNPAWILAFSQPDPTFAGSDDFYATSFEGQITILQDDYSVKKIEGSATSIKQNRQGKSLAVGNSNSDYYTDVSYNFEVTYSQLKPEVILLHKKYRHNGKKVEETSRLTIKQVEMTEVKKIADRDYFVE
jgi:hypothetical protein